MRRRTPSVLVGLAVSALAVTAFSSPASAQPAQSAQQADSPDSHPSAQHKRDDRAAPMISKQRALQKKAAQLVAEGKRKVRHQGGSDAVRVAPGQWAQYGVQDSDQILTFLVDFGEGTEYSSPTGNTCDAGPAGPVHNNIPEPDRSVDNTTYWVDDFSREHYLDMFFNGLPSQNGESFRDFYEQQSSGRYSINGDVSDWVQIPDREACFGVNETNTDMTAFTQEAATAWVAHQRAQGMTDDEIAEYLSRFDQWDRYDYDGDGDFNEPDGYIDHFQSIRGGQDESAGAPAWTVWAHRWYVGQAGQGTTGPDGNKLGGVQIGDTGLWIGDYTTEPENGGLGVFAHEFAHDLGLPDEYDTAGGDNGTGFWTLMSSGSWMGHGKNTIGTTPDHMSAWDKFMLGWLDYDVANAGQKSTHKLGVAEHATKKAQALITVLPKKTVTTELGITAPQGEKYVYSGNGDDRTATATSQAFTVPAGGQLTAQVNYSIEDDWDYAYAEISGDGGQTFTPVQTNLSTSTNPNGQNDGFGITGDSGGDWADLTADLSQHAGQSVQVRFRMVNDAAVHEMGLLVDDVQVGDALSAGFESDASGWTLDKFIATTGTYSQKFAHYYVAENRQYVGYDTTLQQGPYNFGWSFSKPNTVEHYPYQNGLVVWYWDTAYGDNNTSTHPGHGLILPVDSHPDALKYGTGQVLRNRYQPYDAPFGLQATDPVTWHHEYCADPADDETEGCQDVELTTATASSQPGVAVFNDSDPMRYYDPENPQGSVIVGGTGTKIKVISSNKNGMMTIHVR
ncbi:MAG: immune inhibitor A domain-containing protein [Nocardioidaceae bacterium]